MSTRLKGVVVTFDSDIRADDAEVIITAIRCIRRVATVDPLESTFEHDMAVRLAKVQLTNKILELLR